MSTRLRCRTCGSTATHSTVYGMPTAQTAEDISSTPWRDLGGCLIVPGLPTTTCLTCGAQDTVDSEASGFEEVREIDRSVAEAVTRYAAACRAELDQSTASAVSHAGLWLLLAGVAEHATGSDRSVLEQVLGLSVDQASDTARRLLSEPHPTLAAAARAWAASDATTPLDLEGRIPSQDELDAWAVKHTRGLIERFPVEVSPETRVLLATALILEPRWVDSLDTNELGELVLHHGLQTIVQTQAAGPVVVAKPHSRDGVDVLSVAAAPNVPPARVWQAVDEVVALLNAGALRHCSRPDDLPESSDIWRVWVEERALMTSDVEDLPKDAAGRPRLWRSCLPEWATQDQIDLTEAPGVQEIARTILPDEPAAQVSCRQAVRAEYDRDGFRAAAVTAMGLTGSAPDFTLVEVERVELDLTGPHAVVAIARGGAWEGIPLLSAWVTRKMHQAHRDTDWESLELLDDTDPDEAAELRAYKSARMRARGAIPPL